METDLQIKKQHALRMYCIDTEALVYMFNGGSCYSLTIHPKCTCITAFWHPGGIYAVHP